MADRPRDALVDGLTRHFPNSVVRSIESIAGDASTRRYWRLRDGASSRIVMDYGEPFVAPSLDQALTDIMTEAGESERRPAEFAERTSLFMDNLDLDEFFAQLLVSEGFTSLEEVAYVEVDELLSIDGVDEGTAEELQARARDVLEEANRKALENARAMGVEDSLVDFEGLTPQMIEALAEDGVKTLEDFATCADWELAGGWTTVDGERVKDDGVLEKFDVSLEEAQNMVMTARIQLGWVDPADLIAEEDEDEAGEATAEEAGA